MYAAAAAYQGGQYEEAQHQVKLALKEAEAFGEHDPRYATSDELPGRGLPCPGALWGGRADLQAIIGHPAKGVRGRAPGRNGNS